MQDIMGASSASVPDNWISSTSYVDSDHPAVKEFLTRAVVGAEQASETEKAIRLFNSVRDDIRYDPYQISFVKEDYHASYVADLPAAYCVPKAILLTACLRAIGIPAGVGFADVKNHLNSPKLSAIMETDLFAYHGYVALKLNRQTFKVTPTFNKDLCERFGVKAIDFDGTSDALFHEYDSGSRKHMEYVKDRGIFENPPMDDILVDLGEVYPKLKDIKSKAANQALDADFAA
ncbi:MAG: transglutaminase family protein [Sneathiella sp.]|nr:transglutaminase family protein [Sneathiella sp.]